MKAVWLGSLKGEERENFKLSLLNSKIVLDKLLDIVYNMRTDREQPKFADYDSPSWSHKQAHTNGYLEALDQIIEILKLEPTPNGR